VSSTVLVLFFLPQGFKIHLIRRNELASPPQVTSTQPCPSEQEIFTGFLGEDEAAQWRH
jgi:hypothetical protein